MGFEESWVWMIVSSTVIALYRGLHSYTYVGLSESLDVEVGLHQVLVLSPQLFDVVSSEVRTGMPSELPYADDLVLMAPTMEQIGRRVAEWRASLLDKGLKENA